MTEVTDAERLRLRERPNAWPVMRQVWRHLALLHWPVDPADIARRLPPGLEIDTYGGAAYIGIVPFTVPTTRAMVVGPPATPPFHEINVRTYVHRRGRDPGVWFFSLDAESRLAVVGARVAYALPYFHARMTLFESGAPDRPEISYESHRRWRWQGETVHFRGRYQPTGPVSLAAPGSLEFFLAERYLLYAFDGRRLRTARVFHQPYPLQPAAVFDLEETLTRAAGFPEASSSAPPLVHYARELDVKIYRPHFAPADEPRLDNVAAVR